MPITEGWCVEARCDRCGKMLFMPYRANVSTFEQLRRMGWRAEESRALCPRCAALAANAERLRGVRNDKPKRFRGRKRK